jgi:hypothetical protein
MPGTDMHAPHPEPSVACANCAAPLAAEYCGQCGQRRFRPEDRTLRRLLGQFLAALTDLDSRAWRSVRALLLQPGRLTQDWFAGRRARWMSPVALFLLANLVYFLVPGITDFDLPLRNHVSAAVLHDLAGPERAPRLRDSGGGQLHSPYTEDWVRARVAQGVAAAAGEPTGGDAREVFEALERDYAQASSNYSKLLIILHVPFLALGLQLLMLGTRRYYAEHFVAALHYFAFVLAFVELVLLPASTVAAWLGSSGEAPGWAKLANIAILMGYAALMLRRAYGCGWARALVGGLVLPMLLAGIHITAYRALQFAIVFALA